MWEKVLARREELGYTNYKISNLTGIPESTLRSYEKRGVKPSFENVCKIADVLGLDLDVLKEEVLKNET
ncbi:helix-turn-helix domain-containing protein [Ligilactobacillus faecis]|uniref:helix-turn-helix domain-containing protein n=1 Tax=Ligilactobacillus faecis TaxID=762833 RepID=UPI0024686B50|nr:helix-turn-helix transcriptional regulator [Ligilactobacillus faecis]WGN89012.1 helix-turn-helix transcriptional regulator [Ligilactobacillus faecis]